MKVLVKSIKENVALVVPGTLNCIDYHRFRVMDNVPDMERWETRGLIKRHYLKDEATDGIFLTFWERDKSKAVSAFLEQFSISAKAKVEPIKEEKEAVVETEKTTTPSNEEENEKKAKSYKRR